MPSKFSYRSIDDYRQDFIDLARTRGATVRDFKLENSNEFIRIASRIPDSAKTAVIHMTGVHGVEGYAGCEAQNSILNDSAFFELNVGQIFISVVNPFGMRELRRFNSENVDLNRNLLLESSESYSGSNPVYRELYNFFNPTGAPSRIEPYLLKAILKLTKFNLQEVKQALGEGQYDFSDGLYFGGNSRQSEIKTLVEIFTELSGRFENLLVIDLHTGLGDYGGETIYCTEYSNPYKQFERASHKKLTVEDYSDKVGFVTRGDIQRTMPKIFTETNFTWLLEEFGTHNPIKMLGALRDESRYTRNGGKDRNHWSRRTLRDLFSPPDKEWRNKIVAQAISLYSKVLRFANDQY